MNYFFSVFILFSLCSAQYRSDFMISDSGSKPTFDIDSDNNIHIVWISSKKDDRSTMYIGLDSLGNSLYEIRRISNSFYTNDPNIETRKNTSAIVWEDGVSSSVTIFSSYIKGRVFKNGLPIGNEFQIDDGDFNHAAIDAFRKYPKILWHNDSILFSTWSGQGHHSKTYSQSDIYAEKLLMPIQKSGDNYPLNNTSVRTDYEEIRPIKKIASNGYVLLWAERDSQKVSRISGIQCTDSLKPTSPKFTLIEFDTLTYLYRPTAIQKNDGNIIILWSKDTLTNKANIYWQEFTENGAAIGGKIKVNEALAKISSTISSHRDIGGNIIVVWEDGQNIMAQRFSENSTKIGTNFIVNGNLTGIDNFPKVRLHKNKIFTVWTKRNSSVPSMTSIWMNILDFKNPVLNVKNNSIVTNNFDLYQNFPNPFNGMTTIHYNLSFESTVSIKIFNILGQEIKEIVHQQQDKGLYEARWNTELSSGIYFCRLEALSVDGKRRKFISTRKMQLLR
ncbi:MAG: T9SS type A sorting domain-containing protein [Bacteroidota bacterium]